jgi:hypothetical protein
MSYTCIHTHAQEWAIDAASCPVEDELFLAALFITRLTVRIASFSRYLLSVWAGQQPGFEVWANSFAPKEVNRCSACLPFLLRPHCLCKWKLLSLRGRVLSFACMFCFQAKHLAYVCMCTFVSCGTHIICMLIPHCDTHRNELRELLGKLEVSLLGSSDLLPGDVKDECMCYMLLQRLSDVEAKYAMYAALGTSKDKEVMRT